MKWLRELARVLAKANRGMVWTTPTGFRVVHETREPKTQRIATSDRTLIVYQEDETRKIDSRRQADGIVALNRLGIAEQTQRKSMFQAGATESMASVANGRTDVAFALVSEIVPAAGVQLAGPLPSEFLRPIIMTSGISTYTKNRAAADKLIQLLMNPEAETVIKSTGLRTVTIKREFKFVTPGNDSERQSHR